MRNAQFKNYFFALIILTICSCQKDALIDVDVVPTNPQTSEVTDAEAVLFSIENGEITADENPIATNDFIKLPNSIDDLEKIVLSFQSIPYRVKNAEELCEENTIVAYRAALKEANASCKPVFAEVVCELGDAVVLATLHVYPTVDCMTPLLGDPTK